MRFGLHNAFWFDASTDMHAFDRFPPVQAGNLYQFLFASGVLSPAPGP